MSISLQFHFLQPWVCVFSPTFQSVETEPLRALPQHPHKSPGLDLLPWPTESLQTQGPVTSLFCAHVLIQDSSEGLGT